MSNISLRHSTISDLELLFEFQADEEAIYMAAFMPKDPHDKQAYIDKWTRLMKDPSINTRTILLDGLVVGAVSKFVMEGDAEITYSIDKKYWGQGIATKALQAFLLEEKTRPIFGRTAFDNIGSQRVLEKCGFVKTGTDKGFANARGMEIAEFIYRLS